MTSFSINNTQHELDKQEYTTRLDNMTTRELLKEFFTYLDYKEESEAGKVFSPIAISCVRAVMTQPLDMVLERLRKECKHET